MSTEASIRLKENSVRQRHNPEIRNFLITKFLYSDVRKSGGIQFLGVIKCCLHIPAILPIPRPFRRSFSSFLLRFWEDCSPSSAFPLNSCQNFVQNKLEVNERWERKNFKLDRLFETVLNWEVLARTLLPSEHLWINIIMRCSFKLLGGLVEKNFSSYCMSYLFIFPDLLVTNGVT